MQHPFIQDIIDCQPIVNDPLFATLADMLDRCSDNNGSCTKCLKVNKCRGLWDEAAEVSKVRSLRAHKFQIFYKRYKAIFKENKAL